MAGIYRQRHPERTVFYKVLFHYFGKFLFEYETRFEREHGYFRPVIKEVMEKYLDCGNQMRVIAFIEDHKVIDKIIRHLKITFQAERPPPPQVVQHELLMAAEKREEYF